MLSEPAESEHSIRSTRERLAMDSRPELKEEQPPTIHATIRIDATDATRAGTGRFRHVR